VNHNPNRLVCPNYFDGGTAMADVFKQLDARIKLKAEEHPEGITILDLVDLPPALKNIMKIMLREHELSYEEIITANKDHVAGDQLSEEDLQDALNELSRQFWLICRGEGSQRHYQVNLRYKKGIKAVWSILDERINALGTGDKT
jgi:hypothetical protein